MTRHFLDPAAQGRFTQARFDAIERIGALAGEVSAEFVVVAGDVFESNRVDRKTVVAACEALKAIAVPVYLLPGNHDPLDAGSVFRSATFMERAPAHVHVLQDAHPVLVRPGVEVVGAPWSSKRPLTDLVAEACGGLAPGADTVRIAVGHGAVDTLGFGSDNPAAIRVAQAEAALADGRIQYVALGDRHSRTAVGTSGRIWYSGAPEPTDYDEQDPGQVLEVECTADAVAVRPHRVGTWAYVRYLVTLNGEADLDLLAAWLEALPNKARTVLDLVPTGTLTLEQMARYEDLLDDARALCGAVESWERHADLRTRPSDADFARLALTGFAATALAELRTAAADADAGDAAVARDALALLVRLADPKP